MGHLRTLLSHLKVFLSYQFIINVFVYRKTPSSDQNIFDYPYIVTIYPLLHCRTSKKITKYFLKLPFLTISLHGNFLFALVQCSTQSTNERSSSTNSLRIKSKPILSNNLNLALSLSRRSLKTSSVYA